LQRSSNPLNRPGFTQGQTSTIRAFSLSSGDFLFDISLLFGLYIRCLYILLKKKVESGLKE